MSSLLCTLFDGATAIEHMVLVSADEAGLLLQDPNSGFAERVPHGELFLGQTQPGQTTLRRDGNLGWRLQVPDPSADWLSRYKSRDGLLPWIQQVGLGKVIAGTLASVALVALIAFKFVDWVVPVLPERTMRDLGDRVAADVTSGYCLDRAAMGALNRMTARMFPDQLGRDLPLTLRVSDDSVTNAFAAPGGVVVIYRGIIDDAKSPDEVAAVIAHEFGHVKYRHPERALVRAFGVGILLGGAGGDIGSMADVLMTLANSRDYERQADTEAHAALARANISPAGMANFFARLATEESKATPDGLERIFKVAGTYLSTHPDLDDRSALAKAQVKAGVAYQPALTADEWQQVQSMCDSGSETSSADPKAD